MSMSQLFFARVWHRGRLLIRFFFLSLEFVHLLLLQLPHGIQLLLDEVVVLDSSLPSLGLLIDRRQGGILDNEELVGFGEVGEGVGSAETVQLVVVLPLLRFHRFLVDNASLEFGQVALLHLRVVGLLLLENQERRSIQESALLNVFGVVFAEKIEFICVLVVNN